MVSKIIGLFALLAILCPTAHCRILDLSKKITLIGNEIQKIDMEERQVPAIPNCGQEYYLTSNIPLDFASPNYPYYFSPGINCLWILRGPINSQISITCSPFSLPCYIGNGLGFSKTAQLNMSDAEYFCGTGTASYKSTGSAMTVNLQGVTSGYVRCSALAVVTTTIKPVTSTTKVPSTTLTKTTTRVSTITTRVPTTSKTTTRVSTTITKALTTSKAPTCACGMKGQSRIVNGNATSPGDWPWQVMLRYGSNEDFGCGGVLIDRQWVLTAGHCIKDYVSDPSSVKAELGAYYRAPPTGTPRIVSKLEKIILHENYNKTIIDNDIALLKLVAPINYTNNIRPACLPIGYNMSAFTYQKATVTGWGAMGEGGALADVLMGLTLPVLSTEVCQPYYQKTLVSKITSNMFCTYAKGQDACQGDSGGPLNWQNPFSGRITVIGLVSWGIGCARDNQPGVYTKIANYIPWIEEKTGLNFCTA